MLNDKSNPYIKSTIILSYEVVDPFFCDDSIFFYFPHALDIYTSVCASIYIHIVYHICDSVLENQP